MSAEARLKEIGLTLPEAPRPVAAYVPSVRSGNLVFVSGQIAFKDGKLAWTGKVGRDLPLEAGQAAARQCALNALAVVRAEIGTLDAVERIVRVAVFVASADGFTDQPKVANGASELLVDVFGERGRHARAAVGVSELPLGSPVEVELVVEVRT